VSAWSNWAGNQVAHPASVEHPSGVEEVSLAVKRAAERGQVVRVAGSGHSFTPAVVTDGVLLHLDRLSGVVSVDHEAKQVTVQAGMPLHRLHGVLAAAGLAMTNLGDIDRQTIAGALSTGTHGTGERLGGLATQIAALELVLGDGSVVSCSPTQRQELFSAARVSFGSLGIITAVTLQCEPAFELIADEQPMKVDEVLDRYDEFAKDNAHFEFYWFPHTDRTLVKRNNRPKPGEPLPRLSKVRELVEDELLANVAYGAVCRLGRIRPSLVPRLNNAVAAIKPRRFAQPSYDVFVSPRRVRFVEMEYAVPRAHARAAFDAIRKVIEREQLLVSFPIEARVAAPDDIPLSTGYGRDTAYFAIHMYRGVEFERYFKAVEAEMRALDGRPHWGKMHYRTAEDLRPAYPKFDEFLSVRDSVDPQRVFANDYVKRVLGP
jgi:L-gulonolactone oxidase